MHCFDILHKSLWIPYNFIRTYLGNIINIYLKKEKYMDYKCWSKIKSNSLVKLHNKDSVAIILHQSPVWGNKKTSLPKVQPNIDPRSS